MTSITPQQEATTVKNFHIQQNVPLADKNWFKTGGKARHYCEPTTAQEFAQALNFAQSNNLEIFMLGDGANILISDDGFDGLVIRPQLKNISFELHNNNTAHVTAQAGVQIPQLIEYCLDNNLTNLEEFSGIPGTVGGATYINLHYYQFFLADFLVSAQVIEKKSGNVITVQPSWFEFGYDISRLHAKDYYLLSATFNTKQASEIEIAYARGRRQEIIRHRTSRFPNSNTCGSFFRNFLPEEVKNTDKKLIYVAYYLDKIGVKGELNIGGATVSYQHANMIVTNEYATSSDVIKLAQLMQHKVKKEFNITPQPECQLVGFKNNPL